MLDGSDPTFYHNQALLFRALAIWIMMDREIVLKPLKLVNLQILFVIDRNGSNLNNAIPN